MLFLECSTTLKISAQAFEAEDFLHIFLRFWGFWGSISYKHFSYSQKTCIEKVYRYYKIPSSEDSHRVSVDTVSQNNLTKLRALNYGVAVIVIVSKGKEWKIPSTRVIGRRINIKEIAVPCQISSANSVSRKKSC